MAEPMQTQPLEIDDFSGGKTDNYIAGKPNQFQDADNMVLKKYGDKAKLVTRAGFILRDSANYRIPSENRLVSLAENEGTLFQMSGRNVYHVTSGAWQTVAGPTGNPVFSLGDVSNYIAWAKWNKHLLLVNDALSRPQKIFHNGTTWVSRTLGLPAVDVSGITISSTGAGVANHVYAFIHSDSYTIDTVAFQEVSAVETKTHVIKGYPVSITDIPVLANGSTDNYNTTSLKVQIYRTSDGGTTFYKVGEVTNGTTTFSDSMTDATLQTQAAIYTDGGVVDFEQAPKSKYILIQGDTAFYLGVQDGSVVYGNRVLQSIPGAMYASPSDFYVDVQDDITGGGVVGIYPVVFCKSRCYRIEGRFDDFGQGGLIAREISNTVGCVSNRSIVSTNDGRIMFAAADGFYQTDGFSIQKLSSDFNTSYQEIVQTELTKSRIYGAFDPFEKRIWWAAQRDVDSNDNDIVFVAHLQAPTTPFTTLSGGNLTDNFAPSSLLFLNDKMLHGDRRGYLFEHNKDRVIDPKIDTTTTPNLWLSAAIIYDYRSPAFDFGTTMVRKWVPRIVVNADNATNLSLRIQSNNDNKGVFNDLAEINYSANAIWGDADAIWRDPDARWNYSAVIDHWRRFPANGLRCTYKQVRMSNAFTDVETSIELGTASSDAITKIITLDDATKTFTSNAIDYYISFGIDNFTREWLIIDRPSPTEILVSDSGGLLLTMPNRPWKIRGHRRGEVFNLLSYVIQFAPLTMTQQAFRQ